MSPTPDPYDLDIPDYDFEEKLCICSGNETMSNGSGEATEAPDETSTSTYD